MENRIVYDLSAGTLFVARQDGKGRCCFAKNTVKAGSQILAS